MERGEPQQKRAMPRTPQQAYQHALDAGFIADSAQHDAMLRLQACYDALLKQGPQTIAGVYLCGPVGRGKTWLMDQFFQSVQAAGLPAKRLHFHHFMRWTHQRLFALIGTSDPLQTLAQELRAEASVLCFDELFVSDIGDAMILGGLLQALFANRLVLVATSNQLPQELYANGFNRERLLPAIAAIEQHMQVIRVDGGQDHRLHPGMVQQRYWLKGEGSAIAAAFAALAAAELAAGEHGTACEHIELGHLHIPVIRRSKHAIWFRFHDLCEQPLAALDFITLCDQFAAIFLSDVPDLSGQQRPARIARGTEDAAECVTAGDRELPALSIHDDSVRRFIALVDECYDRHIPLYLEAAVPLDALYTEGYLQFPFRRTLSRLKEMQLQRFGMQRYEATTPVALPD